MSNNKINRGNHNQLRNESARKQEGFDRDQYLFKRTEKKSRKRQRKKYTYLTEQQLKDKILLEIAESEAKKKHESELDKHQETKSPQNPQAPQKQLTLPATQYQIKSTVKKQKYKKAKQLAMIREDKRLKKIAFFLIFMSLIVPVRTTNDRIRESKQSLDHLGISIKNLPKIKDVIESGLSSALQFYRNCQPTINNLDNNHYHNISAPLVPNEYSPGHVKAELIVLPTNHSQCHAICESTILVNVNRFEKDKSIEVNCIQLAEPPCENKLMDSIAESSRLMHANKPSAVARVINYWPDKLRKKIIEEVKENIDSSLRAELDNISIENTLQHEPQNICERLQMQPHTKFLITSLGSAFLPGGKSEQDTQAILTLNAVDNSQHLLSIPLPENSEQFAKIWQIYHLIIAGYDEPNEWQFYNSFCFDEPGFLLDNQPVSVVEVLAAQGFVNTLKMMFNARQNFNITVTKIEAALLAAAKFADDKIVKFIMMQDIKIDDKAITKALIAAIIKNKMTTVKVLTEHLLSHSENALNALCLPFVKSLKLFYPDITNYFSKYFLSNINKISSARIECYPVHSAIEGDNTLLVKAMINAEPGLLLVRDHFHRLPADIAKTFKRTEIITYFQELYEAEYAKTQWRYRDIIFYVSIFLIVIALVTAIGYQLVRNIQQYKLAKISEREKQLQLIDKLNLLVKDISLNTWEANGYSQYCLAFKFAALSSHKQLLQGYIQQHADLAELSINENELQLSNDKLYTFVEPLIKCLSTAFGADNVTVKLLYQDTFVIDLDTHKQMNDFNEKEIELARVAVSLFLLHRTSAYISHQRIGELSLFQSNCDIDIGEVDQLKSEIERFLQHQDMKTLENKMSLTFTLDAKLSETKEKLKRKWELLKTAVKSEIPEDDSKSEYIEYYKKEFKELKKLADEKSTNINNIKDYESDIRALRIRYQMLSSKFRDYKIKLCDIKNKSFNSAQQKFENCYSQYPQVMFSAQSLAPRVAPAAANLGQGGDLTRRNIPHGM